MFYKNIGEKDKAEITELYSPYRTITSPKSQQYGKAHFNLNINEHLRIEGQLSGSRMNKNTIIVSLENGQVCKVALNLDNWDN